MADAGTPGGGRLAVALMLAAMALPAQAQAQALPTVAAAQHAVSGQVRVVGGSVDPAMLDVRLNGEPVTVDGSGRIAGAVVRAERYQLRVAGAAVFPATYDFAGAEVAGADGGIVLPPVEAVARAPGRVELFFGGDAMIGRRFETPIWGEPVRVRQATRAADMAALLAPMRPYFESSDLASVNLETVLATATPGDAPDKSVVFFTHSDAAGALASAGIDFVTLGNNHVYDFLEPGLGSTVAALDTAGLRWSGAGANESEALRAARIALGGSRFAMLGYVGWQGRVEPNQVAGPDKGGAAFGTDASIAESVRREVAAGWAPIVQYHGSTEYSARPTEISERRMKRAIDEGAALVVAHHPHVPQGFELYRGRLIAYSLGNFLFDQYFPETHGSIALKVWMDGDRLFRAEIVPLQILDYRPVPALGGVRQAMLRRIVALSAERATPIALVGGHGVIVPEGSAAAAGCAQPYGAGLIENRFPISGAPGQCSRAAEVARGRDLLMRGDFEAVRFDDAVDRSWATTGATLAFEPVGRSGGVALVLRPSGTDAASVAPKSYFRPAGAGRYSFAGWIKSAAPARVEALVQFHPSGSARFEALETAPWQSVGAAEIGGGDWQFFRFDFTAEERLPLRPMLRLSGATDATLDDVAFIAWDESDGAPGDWSHGE
ncbi:CapA family protein [Sphingosinithalassobacter sp. LHW66-3]|uniref:CapA family protein n=1 Tax=Sphingosinithalassobacter sp. LHW66-3 TaxID=3424718 RepID=UPI003D6B175E